MKVCRLAELPASDKGHVFRGLVPGRFIYSGGLVFSEPGRVAHEDEPRHVHEDGEIFVILQGKAVVHFDHGDQAIQAGEVMIVEPGENHHLESDTDDPSIVIWLHAGPEPHPAQAA